jgi:hypothetical protein
MVSVALELNIDLVVLCATVSTTKVIHLVFVLSVSILLCSSAGWLVIASTSLLHADGWRRPLSLCALLRIGLRLPLYIALSSRHLRLVHVTCLLSYNLFLYEIRIFFL